MAIARRLSKKKSNYTKRSNYRKSRTRTKVMSKDRMLRRIIRQEIHKNIENKTALAIQNVVPLSNANITPNLNCQTCIPTINISQGTGQSNRIANVIKTRSLYMKFVLYPSLWNITSNAVPKPQMVLMFFGKVKGQRDRQPTGTDFAKLWQNGSTSIGPYSDLRDLTQYANKDYFTIYKILRFKVGNENITGTGNSANAQYYTNNDFKYNVSRTINLTKYCPKTLKFNDNTLSPTNDNLYMWAYVINADGTITVPSAGSTYEPTTLSYTFSYTYEDA